MFSRTHQALAWGIVPLFMLNIMMFPSDQSSNAAVATAPETEVAFPTDGGYTQEERDNISVYQQAAPAVISINTRFNQGAGAIITHDGIVVTNKHVVQGVQSMTVKTADNKQYQASLISTGSVGKDLAFLRIKGGSNFPTIPLGDSGQVRVGQRILAIGSPFGLDGTLTTGIVSRIDRTRNMLQTDAAINPGNSGGPLLNTRGQLIGINRSIVNPVGASSAGISFAVPVNVVKQDIASLGIQSVAFSSR